MKEGKARVFIPGSMVKGQRDNVNKIPLTKSREMPRFRLRAKQFIITYSQVNNGHDESNFDTSLQETPIDYIEYAEQALGHISNALLARERHEDGGIHYHMFLGFSEAATIRSPTELDYLGKHPNIKSVRSSPGTVWDYVGKDGDIVFQRGDRPGMGTDSTNQREHKRTRDDAFNEALSATTKEEFLAKLRILAPRDYVVCHGNIRAYSEWAYAPVVPEYRGPNFVYLDTNIRERNRILAWRAANVGELNGRR